jgi:hypothetical protein
MIAARTMCRWREPKRELLDVVSARRGESTRRRGVTDVPPNRFGARVTGTPRSTERVESQGLALGREGTVGKASVVLVEPLQRASALAVIEGALRARHESRFCRECVLAGFRGVLGERIAPPTRHVPR